MEEKRREDQSGEVDSSTHEENSEGAAPVRKLKQFSWPLGVFRQLMLIFFFSLSPGSRSQKWGGGVLLLSVAKGPLCCAAPGLEPPQLPARQRAVQTELVEPAAAAGWAEGPEGAVWPDEESAQVGRPNLLTVSHPTVLCFLNLRGVFPSITHQQRDQAADEWTRRGEKDSLDFAGASQQSKGGSSSVLLGCYCVTKLIIQQLIFVTSIFWFFLLDGDSADEEAHVKMKCSTSSSWAPSVKSSAMWCFVLSIY